MFETNPIDRLDQIDAMRAGVDYKQKITIRNFSMTVRPLTIMETNEIASSVVAELRKLPVEHRNATLEHTLMAKETLKRASTSDVGKGDWQITEPILNAMTVDEVLFMYKQYVMAMDRVNPALEKMSTKEVQELVEDLKKNEPQELDLQLTALSFLQLVSLVQYFLTKGD